MKGREILKIHTSKDNEFERYILSSGGKNCRKSVIMDLDYKSKHYSISWDFEVDNELILEAKNLINALIQNVTKDD